MFVRELFVVYLKRMLRFSTTWELKAVLGITQNYNVIVFCSRHYDLFPIEIQSQLLSALHAKKCFLEMIRYQRLRLLIETSDIKC